MNPDFGEGEELAEAATPIDSRERRTESARTWRQMQYMGGLPSVAGLDDSGEEEE